MYWQIFISDLNLKTANKIANLLIINIKEHNNLKK